MQDSPLVASRAKQHDSMDVDRTEMEENGKVELGARLDRMLSLLAIIGLPESNPQHRSRAGEVVVGRDGLKLRSCWMAGRFERPLSGVRGSALKAAMNRRAGLKPTLQASTTVSMRHA